MGFCKDTALVASAARTASASSTAVDTYANPVGGYREGVAGLAAFYLTYTAKTGTAPTLDVKIQDSEDNSTFTDVVSFTQVSNTATGSERKAVTGPLRRYIRANWTIGGSNTPGQTFKVDMVHAN